MNISTPIIIALITVVLTFMANTYLQWLKIKWEQRQKENEFLRSRSYDQLRNLYAELELCILKASSTKEFLEDNYYEFLNDNELDKEAYLDVAIDDYRKAYLLDFEKTIAKKIINKIEYCTTELSELIGEFYAVYYVSKAAGQLEQVEQMEKIKQSILNRIDMDYRRIVDTCGIPYQDSVNILKEPIKEKKSKKNLYIIGLIIGFIYMYIGGSFIIPSVATKQFGEILNLMGVPITILGIGITISFWAYDHL